MDDDDAVRTVVRWQLADAGCEVIEAAEGGEAIRRIRGDHPALVVLDLSLPGLSGLEVLQQVRSGQLGREEVPIIVLSGRGSENDRITGLDLGADDYLIKPFSPGELAARVRSVLRRAPAHRAIVDARLRIDEASRRVLVDEHQIDLTPREFDLLSYLGTHPDRAFTRAELVRQVWGCEPEWLGEATVTEHVHRLRQKLDGACPLRTVRGVGYQWVSTG